VPGHRSARGPFEGLQAGGVALAVAIDDRHIVGREEQREPRLRADTEDDAANEFDPLYPFAEEQVRRIALTEPTLRDMLQQFRHLFDHVVYGPDDGLPPLAPPAPA